jgi:acyl-CoA dehydrogenase
VHWVAAAAAASFFLAAQAVRLLHANGVAVHGEDVLKDAGLRNTMQSSMAKAFCADMAMKIATDAVQIYGGYGYSKEYEVERLYREIRALRIYEGASEVQKIVIARQVLAGLGGGA